METTETATARKRGQHGANILWPIAHEDALKHWKMVDGLSYREIAAALNEKFGTNYTRNATVGKASRMKLLPPKVNLTPEERAAKRKARAERMNGHTLARRRVVAIKPPREETELRCAAIDPKHITLMDLEPHHCRWPFGEGPITFCGHDKFAGSYCAAHFFLGIGAGTPSERAAGNVSYQLRGAL